MPIEQNGVKVKRLYKREGETAVSELVWGQESPVSGICSTVFYNPIGTQCLVAGDKMIVTASDIGRTGNSCYELTCYLRETVPKTDTEIKLLHDSNGNVIHKRSNIIYADEDYTAISSEIKTWGVEELNPPTPPTKQFHNFKHWESNVEGIIGTNTLAPKTDAVYRPVYEYNENYIVDISVNGGSYIPYEWDGVYTWNGVPAFVVQWVHPQITFTGLKNRTSLTPAAGATVDIKRNFDFPKTIKNIYPVDVSYSDFYGPMGTTVADLSYPGGNYIFWNSLGMPIGFDGTDIAALIFVFELP